MGSHSADFSAQTARGAAFRCDTHISAPHARCAASSPTSARRGIHNASISTTHDQEALQGTNICSHQRFQEPVIHRAVSRCGLISTRYLATCGHARRSPALLIVPDDELAQRVRPDRDPSPWRRCGRLAAVHAVDGLQEGSGLDVTAELQHDEKRIAATWPDAEGAAPSRSERRARQRGETRSSL